MTYIPAKAHVKAIYPRAYAYLSINQDWYIYSGGWTNNGIPTRWGHFSSEHQGWEAAWNALALEVALGG